MTETTTKHDFLAVDSMPICARCGIMWSKENENALCSISPNGWIEEDWDREVKKHVEAFGLIKIDNPAQSPLEKGKLKLWDMLDD